jgi:hypothetical protein
VFRQHCGSTTCQPAHRKGLTPGIVTTFLSFLICRVVTASKQAFVMVGKLNDSSIHVDNWEQKQ